MTDHAAMQILRSHGRAAASFQILTSDLSYWFADDACVAYAEVGGAWVTLGGAIAAKDRELETTERFAEEARRMGKRVRFFALEHELPADTTLTALQIGEQPVWNPQNWPDSLPKKLRGQLRRDLAKATVSLRLATNEEIEDPNSETRRGIDAVIAQWLDSRRMAPMEFMVQLNPYQLSHERRFFVAELQGKVVAAIIAVPVYGRNGWFLETMLRHPSAPNGSIELLFSHAMYTFAASGSTYVTFGMCPLSGSDDNVMKWIRKGARHFYNFDGLRKFKGKLGPASWEPVYLAYPKTDHVLFALLDAMRAFMPGGFLRFGWRTMVQRVSAVSAVIAALLVPWTALVGLADTAHWFPSRGVQLAWVALDLAMLGGFVALARKFSRTLALALCVCASSDFLASCVQLVSFNASRASGVDWLFAGLGTLMPLVCALFLWSSRNRKRLHTTPLLRQPSARTPSYARAATVDTQAARVGDAAAKPRKRRISSETMSEQSAS